MDHRIHLAAAPSCRAPSVGKALAHFIRFTKSEITAGLGLALGCAALTVMLTWMMETLTFWHVLVTVCTGAFVMLSVATSIVLIFGATEDPARSAALALLESNRDAVLVFDRQGRLVHANHSARLLFRMFGAARSKSVHPSLKIVQDAVREAGAFFPFISTVTVNEACFLYRISTFRGDGKGASEFSGYTVHFEEFANDASASSDFDDGCIVGVRNADLPPNVIRFPTNRNLIV